MWLFYLGRPRAGPASRDWPGPPPERRSPRLRAAASWPHRRFDSDREHRCGAPLLSQLSGTDLPVPRRGQRSLADVVMARWTARSRRRVGEPGPAAARPGYDPAGSARSAVPAEYADRRTGGRRIVKSWRVGLAVLVSVGLLVCVAPAGADTAAPSLPFSQDWSNTGLITTDDDWSGVPGVIGYRGDDLTTATGTDPQAITADGSATPVDVIANQTSPNTLATGGVAGFHVAGPSVAPNGSGTGGAPPVVVNLVTTGFQNIS